MMFERVNPGDPETAFLVVKNSYSTSALADGDWCAWDIVTDEDGVSVTKPGGASRSAIAGVSIGTIASGSNGVVQAWGYRTNVKCKGGSGSLTSKLTQGAILKFATGNLAAQCFARNSAALKSVHGKFPCGIVITALNTAAKATSGTTARYKVLVRCL